MPLSTSVSDKWFFIAVLCLCLGIAGGFYVVVEQRAEQLASQKRDARYNELIDPQSGRQLGMVLLGTSHTESVILPLAVNTAFYLSAPHTLPPVMYLKAKLIARHHPEVRVVYLEADDHLFFNGPAYSLEGMDPAAKRSSNVFKWNGAFIDSDAESATIFGDVAPYTANPLLLLNDDVKPVLLKRIVGSLFRQQPVASATATAGLEAGITRSCDPALYTAQPDLTQDTLWSAISALEKQRQLLGVIHDHKLESPGPLDNSMQHYFEKTIQTLKSHGIDVVLVQYPETAEFVAAKHPAGQQLYETYIDHLAAAYGLRTLDLRYFSAMGPRFFNDQDHPYAPHTETSPGFAVGKAIMQDFCFAQTGNRIP